MTGRTRAWLLWLRTPKALVIAVLLMLSAAAGSAEGLGRVGAQLGIAVAGAVTVDLVAGRVRRGRFDPPDGAMITGLIVAMVLIAGAPVLVILMVAAVAVGTKYMMATAQSHLFNPAALGLLLCLVMVPTAHSWWGALTPLPWAAISLLIVGAVMVANRVHRIPMVLAFLFLSFAAFGLLALPWSASVPRLADVFRAPFVNAAIFFGGFMLTDPATSPSRPRDQLWFGGIAAMGSVVSFMLVAGLWYLFFGLLAANGWWAWRRTVIASAAVAKHSRWAPQGRGN